MSSLAASTSVHTLDRQVRVTLQIALVIFVYTIGIGILNGLDLVEFSRPQLLSHLHSGTLGWMTLAILAAAMWLFGEGADPPSERSAAVARGSAWLACLAIAGYVIAFATTAGVARPIAGVATLLALIGLTSWSYARARRVGLSVPHLLVLLGLTSSVLGGTFGVINGLAIAFGWQWVPSSFFEAHPGTMEIGFVMPAAMGLAEWGLRVDGGHRAPGRAGWTQATLMFLAFGWVLTSILAGQEELVGLGMIFGIIAIVIFFVRLRREIAATSLTGRTPQRHAMAGGVLLGAAIVYIFVIVSAAQGDFASIPGERLVAFIHLLAVGATTNAILAFAFHLARGAAVGGLADDLVFWGLNVGLIGFVVALTADLRGLIHVFVPILGLSLLLAIVVHIGGLRRTTRTAGAIPS